jgi:polysaccharide biosynthesis transport protein
VSGIAKREPPVTPAVYEPRPQTVWIDDYLDGKQSEISEYIKIVLRHKLLALAVTLAVFAAAGVWTYTTKRLYTSSVNIQIDPEQAVLPYKEVYDSVTADPKYLLTQAQVLKSEALARRIVTQLNLASASNSDEVARQARGFASRLVVTPVDNTQVVKVSYRSEDPVFAARAINTLADEYANYNVESKRDSNTKAKEFLGAELSKQKQKLEQSEQALVQYSRAHNMLLPSDGTNAITQKLNDLNREMTKVEAEVIANQYQALKSTTLDNFPEGLKTNVMRDLESRRSTLELKLSTLTVQFGPKWPEVITLGKELADVRQQLVNGMRRALEQANAEYNLSVAHRERLATALAAQSRLADQLTQDSIQYNILKRDVDTDRQIHEGLLQRLKETDVSAGLKSGNVHVIDRGYVATLPSSPNVPLNLVLGLTLGLLSGVMCAFAVEYLDQTVASPEDVERDLRLPFLGAIPAFAKSWKDANGGLLMPLNGQRPDSGRHFANAESGVYWESYRALRTSLLFSSPEHRPHVILITSALPGEGKTTTSVNLGIALAQTGARTLILELDLRRPKMAHMLAVANSRGMSRYLAGQCELNTEIQPTGIPNLFAVPSGPIPPNPPELIGSSRMDRALELFRRYFEYVIIDGPPVLPVSDALVISSQVDGVVLVVDGRKTATAVAQRARNLLRSVDASVLGVLVNNAKIDVSEQYYSLYPSIGATAYPVGQTPAVRIEGTLHE